VYIDQGNGNILVADTDNSRIQIFNKEGQFLRKFGSEGKEKGQMQTPIGIVMNSRGEIIITENGNSRLQVFDYQGNHLCFLGDKNGVLGAPRGICIDCEDNVYVTSTNKGDPIKVINVKAINNQEILCSIDVGKNGCLMGIAIDKSDNALYVTEFGNHFVYAF